MGDTGKNNFRGLVRGVKKYLVYLDSLHPAGVPMPVVPSRPPQPPSPDRAAVSRPSPADEGGSRAAALDALRRRIGDCRRCPLSATRHTLVFGVGHPGADLVFVGEAPGRDEDLKGEPFVGAAGRLLTKIIQAMGLRREEVYICNVVKCWPPGNRTPLPEEIAHCMPFLEEQISILRPRCIVSLGKVSAQALLGTKDPISGLRGRFLAYRGIPLMPTYHPAYLLRNPPAKKEVWEDMKKVMALLRETSPSDRSREGP